MSALEDRLAKKMVERYSTNAPAAASEWLDEMENLTVTPAELAARRADVWLRNLQQSVKVWQAKMGRVKLEDIKAGAREYGADNYSRNVSTKGVRKYSRAAPVLARTALQIKQEARQIPVTTIDDALRRVRVAIKRWKAIKGTV